MRRRAESAYKFTKKSNVEHFLQLQVVDEREVAAPASVDYSESLSQRSDDKIYRLIAN